MPAGRGRDRELFPRIQGGDARDDPRPGRDRRLDGHDRRRSGGAPMAEPLHYRRAACRRLARSGLRAASATASRSAGSSWRRGRAVGRAAALCSRGRVCRAIAMPARDHPRARRHAERRKRGLSAPARWSSTAAPSIRSRRETGCVVLIQWDRPVESSWTEDGTDDAILAFDIAEPARGLCRRASAREVDREGLRAHRGGG